MSTMETRRIFNRIAILRRDYNLSRMELAKLTQPY